MNNNKHLRRGHPVIFGFIFLFSLIELAISAWLVSRYNLRHDYLSISVRDRTRFLLFTSCWTIAGAILFSVLFRWRDSVAASIGSHGIFMIFTWIFWTAGAAAITAALGGGLNCNGHFTYCGQLNALEGFAWVVWLFVTLAFIVVIVRAISASRNGDGLRGPLVV